MLAFHGSKPFNVEALSGEMSLLGDMLIELALAIGERSNVRFFGFGFKFW